MPYRRLRAKVNAAAGRSAHVTYGAAAGWRARAVAPDVISLQTDTPFGEIRMHRAAVVGSCIALIAKSALAAPGDGLMVTGDMVNVRAGPGMEYRVRLQVQRRQPATELARQGAWVQVELTDLAAKGWIHRSLLQVISRAQPAAAAATDEPALPSLRTTPPPPDTVPAGSADESEALTRFRSSVNMLNERALAAAGVELFAGVESSGNGTVRVLVTDAWNMVPEAGQRSYTNALFGRWRAAAGGLGTVRVQVVDPGGTVVSEKSEP